MTDREYLERMLDFTRKLTDAAESDGLNSDAYNAVLKEIAHSAVKFNHSRRRYVWLTKASIFLLLCVFAWLFYLTLCWLKI